MKKPPYVPTQLEEAIFKIAAQFPRKTHIHVFCEESQMKVRVVAQFRQAVMWEVADFFYSLEELESTMQMAFRNRPGELNKSNVLFVWDVKNERLQKRVVVDIATA